MMNEYFVTELFLVFKCNLLHKLYQSINKMYTRVVTTNGTEHKIRLTNVTLSHLLPIRFLLL